MDEYEAVLDNKIDTLIEQNEDLLEQNRKIAGRVSTIEREQGRVRRILFGDPDQKTPGLVFQAQESAEIVRQWRTLTAVVKSTGKWVGSLLLMVLAALIINLANGLL